MCARDGAVHASQSQLRFPLRYQMGHDLVPHPTDRPTAEAQIGMVPIAEFGRDRTPFRAIVDAPDDRFDRATVFSPRSCATNVAAAIAASNFAHCASVRTCIVPPL